MTKVALAAGFGTDRIGERALLVAFAASLPGYDVVPMRGSWTRPATTYRDVAGSAALVITGEAALARAANIRTAAALAPVAAAAGTPLAFVGVGAGAPSRRLDWPLSRMLVRRADLLLLDDEESSHALARVGAPTPLRISADPAWASVHPTLAVHGGGDVAHVILDGRSGAEATSRLAQVLRGLLPAGLRVRVQPWEDRGRSGDVDAAMARRVVDDAGPHVELVPPPRDLTEARDLISDAGVVVTQRYRAIQAAAESGVPVVPVGDDARMLSLARRLSQSAAGLHRPVSQIVNVIVQAARGSGPSPDAVKAEITRAEAGFALLRLVVEKGAVDLGSLECLPLCPQPWR